MNLHPVLIEILDDTLNQEELVRELKLNHLSLSLMLKGIPVWITEDCRSRFEEVQSAYSNRIKINFGEPVSS